VEAGLVINRNRNRHDRTRFCSEDGTFCLACCFEQSTKARRQARKAIRGSCLGLELDVGVVVMWWCRRAGTEELARSELDAGLNVIGQSRGGVKGKRKAKRKPEETARAELG